MPAPIRSPQGRPHPVTRDETWLSAPLTRQPSFRIYPARPTEFHDRGANAKLVFDRDEGQPASAVPLHQNGKVLRAESVTKM